VLLDSCAGVRVRAAGWDVKLTLAGAASCPRARVSASCPRARVSASPTGRNCRAASSSGGGAAAAVGAAAAAAAANAAGHHAIAS